MSDDGKLYRLTDDEVEELRGNNENVRLEYNNAPFDDADLDRMFIPVEQWEPVENNAIIDDRIQRFFYIKPLTLDGIHALQICPLEGNIATFYLPDDIRLCRKVT